MRLLVIEDEDRLSGILKSKLGDIGFTVDIAGSAADAGAALELISYDAAILDLGLPDGDGLAVLTAARQSGKNLPILILTARDAVEDRVAGLNAGADDYVAKPFDLGELLARAKALIRRGKGQSAAVLKVGDIEISTADLTVRRKGELVTLTAMEYRVLEYLAHRPGAVVSKTELLEHLYDFNWERFSNVIEVYISGLRRKLEDGSENKLIHTLRGQGYILRA